MHIQKNCSCFQWIGEGKNITPCEQWVSIWFGLTRIVYMKEILWRLAPGRLFISHQVSSCWTCCSSYKSLSFSFLFSFWTTLRYLNVKARETVTKMEYCLNVRMNWGFSWFCSFKQRFFYFSVPQELRFLSFHEVNIRANYIIITFHFHFPNLQECIFKYYRLFMYEVGTGKGNRGIQEDMSSGQEWRHNNEQCYGV